jgi:hypothetical protein
MGSSREATQMAKVGTIQVGKSKKGRRDVAVASANAPRRVGDGYLYSTYRFATSAATPAAITLNASGEGFQFFATQIGGTGQGFGSTTLTPLETNLKNAGKVPGEQAYRMEAIGFGGAGDLDVRLTKTVERFGYLKFTTPAYDWLMGPAEMYPLGLNPGGFGSIGGGNAQEPGPGPVQAMRKLNVPIILPPNATFGVTYQNPAAVTLATVYQQPSQNLDFRVAMWGRWVVET